ncbi:siphovirus Gp157 family protein, partial [Noviherbaspirillum sedimenti]
RTMEDLAARHAGLQRAAERGRKLILDLMQSAQREHVTTALFSLAIRKNPPAVVIDCAAALPRPSCSIRSRRRPCRIKKPSRLH